MARDIQGPQSTFDELMQRVSKAAVPVRKIDHGYCVSMYLRRRMVCGWSSLWTRRMQKTSR